RIVGYHFWIEDIILGRINPDTVRFFGWETSHSVMRENALLLEREEREGDETAAFRAIHEELAPYNRNFLRLGKSNMAVFGSIRGYLVAVYVTFAVFIGLCAFPFTYYAYRTGTAVIAQGSLFNTLGIAVVLFSFFVVGWEFATLKHLIYGRFSDAANRIKWKIVFEGSDRMRDRPGTE
ncbi:MAG: hypothetical protein GKC04_03985, partial [Methanomicrobiales archaeon]|nr:hypothetical protein [Methanomicrobiales archaeon]